MTLYTLIIVLCLPGAHIPCRLDELIMVRVDNIESYEECEAKAAEFKARNPAYRSHLCGKLTTMRT